MNLFVFNYPTVEGIEDAQASNTPRPMSFKNQIADSFHAFSVCIMDYFYNQVSLLKGGHNQTQNG